MNTYKIFLASSSELSSDRKEFEILINRKNKDWVSKGAHLDLVIWEDFLDCLSPTRLQDEYDKAIRECDLFVMLYSTKVGKYTQEEFQTAYELFLSKGLPKIYTYCKDPSSSSILTDSKEKKMEDQKSLQLFQQKLLDLGHFQTMCQNTQDFLLQFSQQLDKLASSGFIMFAPTTSNTFPRTFTLPPFKPEVFLGREEDLTAIKERFYQKNTQLLLLSGEGGLGKTSLASEYYHAYQQDYQHTAWILSENNIADALLTSLSKPMKITYDPAMSLEERLNHLILAITSLPKPCLLVIDNVDEPFDLEENYLTLRRLTNFHTLLTTRLKKFHSAFIYPLQTISPEQALELFREHYPYHDPSEDELFFKIREAVGGNTLVLEILAKNLAILNQNENTYTLKDLLEDIQDKGLLSTHESDTESVETTYHAGGKMKYTKPSELISAMYDLGNLSPEEVSLLSTFAVLPPEKIESKVLNILIDPSFPLDSTLNSLALKGWIEFSPVTRSYKCNPLIQDITRSKNEHLYEDSKYMVEQMKKQLEYDPNLGHPLHMSFEEAVLWIRYAESVARILPLQSYSDLILYDRIGRYFQTIADLPKALHYFSLSNHLYGELVKANPNESRYMNNLAISYQNLGAICNNLGDLPNTLYYYLEFNKLREELFKRFPENIDYKNGLAISYSKLGDVYINQGDLLKAVEHYSLYNELREDLSRDFPDNAGFKNGLAISYSKLGDVFTKTGDLLKAQAYFIQFNQIIQELYNSSSEEVSYKFWLALSCQNLGTNYTSTGDLTKALLFLTQFQQLIQELHRDFPKDAKYKYGVAVSYEDLGDLYSAQDEYEKALNSYNEDLRVADELTKDFPADVVYKNVLATAYERLGLLHKNNMNQADLGFDQLKTARILWTELVQEAPEFKEYGVSLTRVQKELEGG